ncbi:MAG: hypothetical protein K0M60_03845 [Hydrogenophaga sp.]|nr:hypothetical protein [Hydrogenophaga sp.]
MLIRTSKTIGHTFAHYPNSEFCPTKEPAGAPYIGLTPGRPDNVAAAAMRSAFRHKWKWHYKRLDEIVPLLSVQEFLEVVTLATERRTWAYEGLDKRDIPYILALQSDFSPWTGRKQKLEGKWVPRRLYWFRFWLESTEPEVDALWRSGRGAINLVRATYRSPLSQNAKPPGIDAIIGQPTDIQTSVDFLSGDEPQIVEYVADKVEDWFRHHPAFPLME